MYESHVLQVAGRFVLSSVKGVGREVRVHKITDVIAVDKTRVT
jgi:hypothetical protein